jgi:hypothetical protein
MSLMEVFGEKFLTVITTGMAEMIGEIWEGNF